MKTKDHLPKLFKMSKMFWVLFQNNNKVNFCKLVSAYPRDFSRKSPTEPLFFFKSSFHAGWPGTSSALMWFLVTPVGDFVPRNFTPLMSIICDEY